MIKMREVAGNTPIDHDKFIVEQTAWTLANLNIDLREASRDPSVTRAVKKVVKDYGGVLHKLSEE